MGLLTDTQGIASAEPGTVQEAIHPFQLAAVIYDLLKLALDYTVCLVCQG